jgi:hypothetical protein
VTAYERRDFAGAAPDSTLSASIDATTTTITVADATSWPNGAAGPFFVVIDPGVSTEEKVRVTSRSGNTLTVPAAGGRGQDETAAQPHSGGAVIRHCYTAVDADEANYAVAETVGKVTKKGDLLVGDAPNSADNLAVGANGLALVADSAQPLGLRYANPAPAAHGHGQADVTGLEAAWTAYTPTWTAATTNPSIGNGTLAGRYRKVGRTVQFTFELNFGSTTNVGSGAYSFGLPVAAVGSGPGYMCPALYTRGVLQNLGMVRVDAGASTVTVAIFDGDTAGDADNMTDAIPAGGHSAGTKLAVSGTYQAAA